MKTEHSKLKEIADEIGYKIEWEIDANTYIYKEYNTPVDVREIIFTQEFMDKMNLYFWHTDWYNKEVYWLLHNLDAPIDYLYNLIKD